MSEQQPPAPPPPDPAHPYGQQPPQYGAPYSPGPYRADGAPGQAGQGWPPPDPAPAPPGYPPYGSPAHPWSPGYASPFPTTPPPHPRAMTAMVLGIVGLAGMVLAPLLFVTVAAGVCSPIAIWLAVQVRRDLRREPGRYSGEGYATAGLVTGIIGLVLFVLALLLVLAFVGLLVSFATSSP